MFALNTSLKLLPAQIVHDALNKPSIQIINKNVKVDIQPVDYNDISLHETSFQIGAEMKYKNEHLLAVQMEPSVYSSTITINNQGKKSYKEAIDFKKKYVSVRFVETVYTSHLKYSIVKTYITCKKCGSRLHLRLQPTNETEILSVD